METLKAIDDFLASCQARNLKPRTVHWYQSTLSRFASADSELPTEPESIESFLSSIDGALETRHTYYRLLKALYKLTAKIKTGM